MSFILLAIVGVAAGFLATRLLKIEADIPTTAAIGVFGALIGGLLLRTLVMMMGWLAGFVGATLGALVLAYVYKRYWKR